MSLDLISNNLDIVIFLVFILVNLVFGLASSKGVRTIKSYAVGDGNFSTLTIVSTIVATWIGGSFFITMVSEAYNQGLSFIFIVTFGDLISFFLMVFFLLPRMAEFLGNLSIAEAMGDMYGKNVRLMTTIAGFVGISGIIAIQLRISGLLFEYAIGIDGTYGIILSGIVITLYSALGGIRSVSFTDIMQFAAFSLVIPAVAFFLFNSSESSDLIVDTLNTNPLFDYKSIFSFSNNQIYYIIYLFLWTAIPAFNPAVFQRIAMAKDIKQAKKSFLIASLVIFLIACTICWTGVTVLSIYPDLKGDNALRSIILSFILDYGWIVGFKGLILAAIMAMVMSTVDSYINSSSVLLIHDLRESLNLKVEDELFSTRLCSMVIGGIAILFALRGGSLLDSYIWASMCYMPIVTVPFVMSVLGFRSSSKSVLFAMFSAVFVTFFWEICLKENMGGVGGLIPGMVTNLVALFFFHYLFKQQGGWVGIKNPAPLIAMREARREDLKELWNSMKSFNLMATCRNNTPSNEGTISLLGLFVMVSTLINAIAMPQELLPEYRTLINMFYPVTLVISMPLIAYPLWRYRWKNKNMVNNLAVISWNASMFFILVCFSGLLALLSNFAEIQMIAFMINIIIVASLFKWRWALFNIISGILITLYCYKVYLAPYQTMPGDAGVEYKISYLLLLTSGVVMMFLKPKQEYMEETEAKVSTLENEVTHLDHELADMSGKVVHYSQRVSDQEKEILRLESATQRILNNVNHELRLPIGNVINFSDMLHEALQKSGDLVLKDLSEEVFKNSTRVSTMILNMLDLATLEVKKVDLQKKTINFGELVEDRVRRCRKIYLQNKKINFELSIQPEVMIAVDPNYVRQMVDNMVINAISYSQEGLIKVIVKKDKRKVVLIVEDQGIGIAKADIYDIFDPFKMGSKTESKAEGRGVGLALCKSVAEAHEGSISAKSNGIKGATFTVILLC